MAIEKLKSHKSPVFFQIPAELIKAVCRIIRCEIHNLVTSISKKEELSEDWREWIILFIYKKGENTDDITYRGISIFPSTEKNYPTSCWQDKLHMRRKLLGIIIVDFDVTGHLLIIYSAFVKCLRKKGIGRISFV